MRRFSTLKHLFNAVTISFIALLSLYFQQFSPLCAAENTYLSSSLYNGKVLRWHDATRTIYISFKPGNTTLGWKPECDQLAKDAFAQWEKALNGQIHFAYTSDPKLTDIDIHWQSNSNGHEIGNQQISVRNGSQVFSNADINLALTDPFGRPMSPAEIKATALHEMGHALGIKGHSPNSSDVMFASANPRDAQRSPNQIGLSQRDIATMRALYASKAAITNPPDTHLFGLRQYDYYLRLGRSAYQQKDYPRAYEYLKTAGDYFPKDKTVHLYTGLCAYNNRDYANAIYQFLDHMNNGGSGQATVRVYIAASLQAIANLNLEQKDAQKAAHKLDVALIYCRWASRMTDNSPEDTADNAKLTQSIQQQKSSLSI